MTKTQAMAALKKMGTAQNRKVYARHGMQEPMFGVSFANLKKLKKEIKTDHKLALDLYATGNGDAQSLATMIVDSSTIKSSTLDTWVKRGNYYLIGSLVAGVASRSPHWQAKMKKWMAAKNEFVKAAGYATLSSALAQGETITKTEGKKIIKTIEREIHNSPNRARYSMNNTLIAVGTYLDLEKEATAAANKIGKIDVDHGETSCKTPDAASYIKKARAHQAKKTTRR